MRKAISILLMLLVGVPLISTVLASGGVTATGVPACCRRDGRHHCLLMAMGAGASGQAAGDSGARRAEFRAPVERCPRLPQALGTAHGEWMSAGAAMTAVDVPMSPAARVAQTESRWRVARERSRQKRGPPMVIG